MKAEHEAQFQEFVRARWSHLVRTAYLLTGDPHHAEDLAQTALAKAYRSWKRIMRADRPEAYVRRILVSCNSDRFRKHRVREALTAAPPEVAGHDDAVTLADTRGALMSALATLPVRQRAVVVMRYWEDLSEAEVAELLGCSVGTVKSQASKGLAKLRAIPDLAGMAGTAGMAGAAGAAGRAGVPAPVGRRVTSGSGQGDAK